MAIIHNHAGFDDLLSQLSAVPDRGTPVIILKPRQFFLAQHYFRLADVLVLALPFCPTSTRPRSTRVCRAKVKSLWLKFTRSNNSPVASPWFRVICRKTSSVLSKLLYFCVISLPSHGRVGRIASFTCSRSNTNI